MQFLGIFWQIRVLSRLPPPGEFAPPPQGNPGSPTVCTDVFTNVLFLIACKIYYYVAESIALNTLLEDH